MRDSFSRRASPHLHRPHIVLDLDRLIAELPARPDTRALIGGFVPPARFAEKSFDNYAPAHPSQEAARARLERAAAELRAEATGGLGRLRTLLGVRRRGRGIYLDGGFGVGKTHLLAALWNEAPTPRSYLSFDELVFFIGLVGVEEARAAFADRRLVAIDEWELDDPGNLKLALAFLRGALADGVDVAVTSNSLPIELGSGRFSQKDFQVEIEELAGSFEVVRVEGEDFRHRHYQAHPGAEYFLDPERLVAAARAADRALLVPFDRLLGALATVHPIRFTALMERIGALFAQRVGPIGSLPDALRWVHFVDTLYDSAVSLAASSEIPLGELFPPAFLEGPFAKKMSRCLSRMEELLGEGG